MWGQLVARYSNKHHFIRITGTLRVYVKSLISAHYFLYRITPNPLPTNVRPASGNVQVGSYLFAQGNTVNSDGKTIGVSDMFPLQTGEFVLLPDGHIYCLVDHGYKTQAIFANGSIAVI